MTLEVVDLVALASMVAPAAGTEPFVPGDGSVPLVVVDLDRDGPVPQLGTGFARVVVGLTTRDAPERHPASAACDVALPAGAPGLAAVEATVAAHPVAAVALTLLLRGAEGRTVDEGLLAESAVYSALQAGPEFAAWRSATPRRGRTAPEPGPVVLVERRDGQLDATLHRPRFRNALDAAMRDELVAAFTLALVDPSIREVHLRGDGDSFCAGGDLDEFGSFPDPATAHLVRLQRSVARAAAAVSERLVVHLHGACAGAGVELPAFAHRVVAERSTTVVLPEVGLGLVPGAGGTVGLVGRIGRHRTARLALTGETLDAATALEWGIVDAVVDVAPARR